MIVPPTSDIAFSQVREDPQVELDVVDRVYERLRRPLRVLVVASGGCTALTLLASERVGEVHAVDANVAQLHLVELRRQAIVQLDRDSQRALVGGTNVDPLARADAYERVRPHLPRATAQHWDAHRAELAFGVNRVGRFEALFRELASDFTELGLDPLVDRSRATAHPSWRAPFDRVFDREKLVRTFGHAAVDYSMSRSFADHFADVFARALERFGGENYFLHQVFRDAYAPGHEPPYFSDAARDAIRWLGAQRLTLHHGAFAELMPRLREHGKFDVIHTSNISDWMPIPSLRKLLVEVRASLNDGGALVARRLNGDHSLQELVAETFATDARENERLTRTERAFFYSEVVVGWRGETS